MAITVKNDYIDRDSDRLHFVKCKFEDLPTTAKDVSIFIDGNVIYFVDNNTIPRQYERIILKNEIENDQFIRLFD